MDSLTKDYILFNDEKYKKQYQDTIDIHLGNSPIPKDYEFSYTELSLLGFKEKITLKAVLVLIKDFQHLI